MFTEKELQVILQLFRRVQITGDEAETIVHMKQKIGLEIERLGNLTKVANTARSAKKQKKK